MNKNFIANNVTDALPMLCRAVMEDGAEVGARGSTRTMELTHVGTTLERPWQREMLLPDRKVNLAAQIAETMWVLAGRNDIEFLSHYLPRAADFSDDGETWRAGYGPRLRKWEGFDQTDDNHARVTAYTDQLAEVVRLLKEDHGTRRAVMSIFDPAVDYQDSKDIPCNNWLSFISRVGKLDLHVAIRSNDLMWGWSGINAFEWSVLQEIVAGLVGLEVGSLHFSTTSLHLYDQHWSKATKLAQQPSIEWNLSDSTRFDMSRVGSGEATLREFDSLVQDWFHIEKFIRIPIDTEQGRRALQQSIDKFPEPMLKSWLQVLQWWWTGDISMVAPLVGTRLHGAVQLAVQPPKPDPRAGILAEATAILDDGGREKVQAALKSIGSPRVSEVPIARIDEFSQLLAMDTPAVNDDPSDFIQFAIKTHDEKHAAYGNSWKKRGEMLGIMANIARKIDRLGGSETADESSADTAMDLMVYLAKYRVWLDEPEGPIALNWGDSDGTGGPNEVMLDIDRQLKVFSYHSIEALEDGLRTSFDLLEQLVNQGETERYRNVDAMLKDAYRLARTLWEQQSTRAKQRDNALRNEKTSWNPDA